MSLRNKLKAKVSLRQQIEESQRGGRKQDMRVLNYFDLKPDSKMTVLIVPDEEGRLWAEYKTHGPNLRINNRAIEGVGSVACIHAQDGTQCPACQYGFEFLNLEKETGDKAYREEAKRWFGRDQTLMTVLVIDSPVEINQDPSGNQLKLMYVPYNIKKMIENTLAEGIIPEDEFFRTILNIRKTEEHGRANYSSSYFDRRPLTDEELDAISEGITIEQYNYETLDAIPRAESAEEVQKWLDNAIALNDKALGLDGGETEQQAEAPKEKKPTPSAASSITSRLKREPEPEPKNDMFEEEEELGESVPEEAPATNSISDLRAKLAQVKRG